MAINTFFRSTTPVLPFPHRLFMISRLVLVSNIAKLCIINVKQHLTSPSYRWTWTMAYFLPRSFIAFKLVLVCNIPEIFIIKRHSVSPSYRWSWTIAHYKQHLSNHSQIQTFSYMYTYHWPLTCGRILYMAMYQLSN